MTATFDDLDLSVLPPAYRAAFEALQASAARVPELEEITRRQEHLIAELNQALHGKKSEKLSEDERQLAFEELETALAEVEEQKQAEASDDDSPRQKRAKAKRKSRDLPDSLPRIEEVIEPDSLECPSGCGLMHKIGEDRSMRIDIIPAQHRIIETIRPKYACRVCTDGVTQAPAPTRLIEGGLPTEAFIAHVLVSKYADHLPLYRQSQILARGGIDIHRSTLADWVGAASFHLKPVVDRLAEHLKRSTKLFMDETTAPVLDPGKGKTKTGYLWALARDDRSWGGDDPPGVVYFYAPGRHGKNAETFLTGFDGILQIDGYPGYNRLTRPSRKGGDPITVAHCWAHARRKLKEVFDRDGSEIAAEGLRRIAELYAVEKDIRGCAPGQRLSARQARSAQLVAAFGEWLQAQRLRVSAKSRLGEKLAYIHNHWNGLQTFLTDGRVEIDSNNVENLVRPIALNRKNALFAGHDEGGRTWGRIASLIETCKINGVEPFA
ncbi:transposase [Rhodovulum steppense]|uniref:Transposase n=1 Tax=Rhodovulum steppense TaxID=540251 RepID=A0A4R1YC26_9RHOB|nr:IS66 family transposase [Rhodovulum steppense]TCM73519.1 transposase [Rhodovulum steppense]